ncbi:MAG TPA: glutathione S-transferase family protein [Dongiaceae bacterium]|nr:glutathione S-transferase family protein [Dongiaceae bacterium]
MLCHRAQRGIEGFGDVEEWRRTLRELRYAAWRLGSETASRMLVIHTIRCNNIQLEKSHVIGKVAHRPIWRAIDLSTELRGDLTVASFKVHMVPGSPFARAVCATLEEKEASYDIVPVAPGTMKQEQHLSRHPFGRVPVLDHDGFTLYETQAILRYVDRVLPSPPLAPNDPKAAARMDQVMGVSDWYLFQGVANVISFQRIVGPRIRGLVPDEKVIAEAMPRARTVMAELSRLLGSRDYFAGAGLSLADLHVAPHLDLLAKTPEWAALSESAGNVAAWLERMVARPSMAATTWENAAAKAASPSS